MQQIVTCKSCRLRWKESLKSSRCAGRPQMKRGWSNSLEFVLLGSYSSSRSENKFKRIKPKKIVNKRKRQKRSKKGWNSHWWILWTGLMLPITAVAPPKKEMLDSSIRVWLLVQPNLAHLWKGSKPLQNQVMILNRIWLVSQEECRPRKGLYFKWWEEISKVLCNKLVPSWRVVWLWETKISRNFKEEQQLLLRLEPEVLLQEVWLLEAQEFQEELESQSLASILKKWTLMSLNPWLSKLKLS